MPLQPGLPGLGPIARGDTIPGQPICQGQLGGLGARGLGADQHPAGLGGGKRCRQRAGDRNEAAVERHLAERDQPLDRVPRLVLQVALLLAWAMPIVAAMTVWIWIIDWRRGLLNWFLVKIGIEGAQGHNWLEIERKERPTGPARSRR